MTYDFNELVSLPPLDVVREADNELRACATKSQLERDRVAGRFTLALTAMFREAAYIGDIEKTALCDTAYDLLNSVLAKQLHGSAFIEAKDL